VEVLAHALLLVHDRVERWPAEGIGEAEVGSEASGGLGRHRKPTNQLTLLWEDDGGDGASKWRCKDREWAADVESPRGRELATASGTRAR
ncbi:hypothetical protein E2562_010462, partial [Oryza meyeriana var. granulata]